MRHEGRGFHPDVKRLLDGELRGGLDALAPALREDAQEALRLLAEVDRTAPVVSDALEARVMAAVRAKRGRRREMVVRLRPWMLVPALAAAAMLVLLVGRVLQAPTAQAPAVASLTVRFVLVAPDAQRVSVAGTFNQWDPSATPLVRTAEAGVWAATLTLPAGEHQYAFVVDGDQWVADPAAPAVPDGFGGGRRNSVLTL
ncbi:MAG: isoamylase early set domain-containing protein [Gemmatimonadales bacterium]|nr:isoamylase early set domain-containing protein [Gemmatimonadales bacterium]